MAALKGLYALARLHGIQTAYRENGGRRVGASPESLLAALAALRVPVRDAADVARLLRHGERMRWERALEPVAVAWEERASSFGVRLRGSSGVRLHVTVALEGGGERSWSAEAATLDVLDSAVVDGVAFTRIRVGLPDLPYGYHDLHVEVRDPTRPPARHRALLISAPMRAAGWESLGERRAWGVFAPLYALWETAGPPSFSLLDRLAEEVARLGGSVVGTLPLLAAFLDRPYEPSPYSPVSRLFWNEVYATAEGEGAAAAPVSASPSATGGGADEPAMSGTGSAAGAGRPGSFDPRAALARKRPAVERLANRLFAAADGWPAELASFRARNPAVEDYARFRALTEQRGPWRRWPDRMRARDVRAGDYPEQAARYHACAQWLAERQLAEARESAEARGVSLYLDLPLGVHPDGYDVWRHRAVFATGAAAGAPPDPLAAGGQNWGFPPLHPEASRLDGHAYFIASIRKHLRFARVLRIDHVMQLHRMFWVPDGVDAARGVYVRYPAEELYAILCLESHRAGTVIVGEDLGTVPQEVRRAMRRHGLPGMWVAEFEMTETEKGALEPSRVPARVLALVDTHDTPTFGGWWSGRDAEIRRDAGLMSAEDAAVEVAGRAELRRKLARGAGVSGAGEVHAELLRRMGRSSAGLVLATMEDLWQETEPQNVPGTTLESNWSRRSRRPLRALRDPVVSEQLRGLNQAREGNG